MKRTKKSLTSLKSVDVVRKLYPIKNDEFIDKTKQQVIDRFGEEALSELKIEDGKVSFRESSVRLVDENKVISEDEGTVYFASKHYKFMSGIISSYADITSMKMTDFGWIINCYNGNRYEYHIKG